MKRGTLSRDKASAASLRTPGKNFFPFYITISMKQCFTTQNKKFNCDYCITNAGDREFDISNGSSFQLGHTALARDQIDGCFKLP